MPRLVTALLAALMVTFSLVLPANANPSPPPDPNLDQKVAADEKVDRADAEITKGHVDLGPRIINGKLEVLARDDSVTPPVWRPLDKFVLRVNDQAILGAPTDPQFAFLGIAPGKKVHVVPQTQLAPVLWLGWNTQDPQITKTIGRGADLVFLRHQGPGDMHVFIANGFDAPTPLWDSRKPAGQKIFMQTNTHVHANWIFTEPGIHLVEVELTATDQATNTPMSARATLRFAVGDTASANEARTAQITGPAPSVTTTATPGSADSSSTASTANDSAAANHTWLWVGAGAGLVIVAGGLALAVRQRSLRAKAWAEDQEKSNDQGKAVPDKAAPEKPNDQDKNG